MSDSAKPSIQSVQRSLIIGLLFGVIFGCVAGIGLSFFYISNTPAKYVGGAYPNEMTNRYQDHYLAMTVDSYIIAPDAKVVQERLKQFKNEVKIATLAERSVAFAAAGRAPEAQLITSLAVELKEREQWNEDTIKNVLAGLSTTYQTDPEKADPAKAQAVGAFSQQMLGVVPEDLSAPDTGEQPTDTSQQPQDATQPDPTAEQSPTESAPPDPGDGLLGSLLNLRTLLCCLFLIILLAIIYLLGRRQFEARRGQTKQTIEWEGAGIPPIKQWHGTYELGQDNYDEFFTIETEDGDFLGESGMGIMDSIPDTKPKQVISFDMGLFDKTDITTLSRVIMSEFAYNDETTKMKIEANPQAEAVLAEPGKQFSFETSAMRVEAKIEELQYGEGGNKYFEKLTVSMDLFLKEGVDLKKGEMDIPDGY